MSCLRRLQVVQRQLARAHSARESQIAHQQTHNKLHAPAAGASQTLDKPCDKPMVMLGTQFFTHDSNIDSLHCDYTLPNDKHFVH